MSPTALIINKFSVHMKKFTNRFNLLTITNKIRNKITSGITNDRLLALLEQTDLVTLDLLI